jgi:hypothetical protein
LTDLISSNKSFCVRIIIWSRAEGKLNELRLVARTFKIANFKDFKNISELSQSLISEQYSQNQFGTFILIGCLKGGYPQ